MAAHQALPVPENDPMRSLLRLLPLLLLGLCACIPAHGGSLPAVQAPTYTITDLGTLGGAETWATGLNNRGVAVGYAVTRYVDDWGYPIRHAFRWSRARGLQDLTPDPHVDSRADAINDHGDIAGTLAYQFPYRYVSAAFWLHHGRFRFLEGVENEGLWPAAISNRRHITGRIDDGGPYSHPFFWEHGRTLVLERFRGYDRSYMWAVNDAGTAVGMGNYDNGDPYQAYTWKSGKYTPLPSHQEGESSGAFGINRRGVVVGASSEFAARWEPDGRLTLLLPSRRERSPFALDISDQGVIVGDEFDYHTERDNAVLWVGRQGVDLNTRIPPGLDWHLDSAIAVNNRGQIVGNGTHHGLHRAFLLTPR